MRQLRLSHIIIPTFAGLLLGACGGGETSQTTPTKTSAVKVKPVQTHDENKPETTSSPATEASEISVEDAMLKRGRIVWFKCRSCHELSVDGPHKVGPNLHAMMGAKAAVKDGFVYSDALKAADIVWTEEALDAFIEKPSSYVKGTKMAFVGIRKESDRQAVIAYIKENAKPAE